METMQPCELCPHKITEGLSENEIRDRNRAIPNERSTISRICFGNESQADNVVRFCRYARYLSEVKGWEITLEMKLAAAQAEARYWKLRYELSQKYTKLVYLNKDRTLLRVSPVPQPELGNEVVESGWFDVSTRGAVLKQIGAD